ncbi:MAG: cysteine--tRNA ligase [Thermoplasmata archaeon]
MALKIFDSKRGSLTEFHPRDSATVRMYVCGPTVYSDAHIGHGRSYVSFDIVRRYLEYKGYDVKLVINITDLDDVIDETAAEKGEEPERIARHFERRFLEDLNALNVEPVHANPRVSDHIHSMIRIIEELNERGYIYEADGNHYFRVTLPGGYGQLTHEPPENLLADDARIENRENPFDFLIWKRSGEGLREWHSALGPGRPGWHIQCYALMRELLGDTVDIHGGGEDLKFPHHESDILLSLAHQGKDISRYHMHNGFVTLKREKMSKSFGNFVPLRAIFKRFSGPAIRFYLLRSHYRETIDYNEEDIEYAQRDLERVLRLMRGMEKIQEAGKPRQPIKEKIASLRRRFMNSMDSDFDTKKAVLVLLEFADWIEPLVPELRRTEAEMGSSFLGSADAILGLTGAN